MIFLLGILILLVEYGKNLITFASKNINTFCLRFLEHHLQHKVECNQLYKGCNDGPN